MECECVAETGDADGGLCGLTRGLLISWLLFHFWLVGVVEMVGWLVGEIIGLMGWLCAR